MTEKNIQKVQTVLSRLHFINVGSKHITDSCKTATIDVVLNNKFPRFVLEEIKMRLSKKCKCDWFTDGSLYVQMKHCSVQIRKI